ncbi:MAG: AmmeMemoRadiSam system protein A [Campylobacterota bacterium]|nr:AmmeMemoRadiSam system protein A [Campylobacterota bacterium]
MAQSELLTLARESIQEVLQAEHTIDREALLEKYPVLGEEIATFVTLTINDELRGCIGSLVAQRPLIDDIIHNAKAAAFQDPRFSPITTSEYLHTTVEISILTPPESIQYSDIDDLRSKIRPNIDGVILSLNGHQATFLPQVWEQLPSFDDFFAHLGDKAGLGSNMLQQHPDIFVYQVEKAKDKPIIK